MSDKPHDLTDTDERAAIKDEIVDELTDELTPPPKAGAQPAGKSSEQIRRLARAEARPLIRTAVSDHATECEHEGPLCKVATEVKSLRTTITKGTAILSFLVILLPLAIAWWNNSAANARAKESIKQQTETAEKVAAKLKIVEDMARSVAPLESLTPTKGSK